MPSAKHSSGFDPKVVANFGEKDVTRLLGDPGIIRSRAKIQATIEGACIFEQMKRDGESFSEFAWKLAGENQSKTRPARFPRRLRFLRKYRQRSRNAASSLLAQ
jgi:DNA-3-methyladenine glycosylase I